MKRILVLYSYPRQMRGAIRDHLHALDGGPEHITYHNSLTHPPRAIRGLEFAGVVLHTTFLCERWNAGFARHRQRYAWIGDLRCPKVAIPQDEYDHSEVLDEWLAELRVSEIFTDFGEDVRPTLYPALHDRVRFRSVFTGYINESAAQRCSERLRPLAERPLDVIYRATNLPYWFGSHGQLKHRIAEVVASRAPAHALATDISTRGEDTIYGDSWNEFLMSGRAVIGVESGSSVLDRRGEIQARVKALLAEHPALGFDEVAGAMTAGWDDWRFFAIGPRHFEAIVTKTAQVLIEGEFSGVLEPNRHYLPLKKDFSNLEEVLEQLRDHRLLQETADRAYEEIYIDGKYRYSDFAGEIRDALESDTYVARPLRSAAFPAIAAVNRVAAAPGIVARLGRLRRLAGTLLRRAGLRT